MAGKGNSERARRVLPEARCKQHLLAARNVCSRIILPLLSPATSCVLVLSYCIHQHNKARVQTAWQCRNRTVQTCRTLRVLRGVRFLLTVCHKKINYIGNYQKILLISRTTIISLYVEVLPSLSSTIGIGCTVSSRKFDGT